MEWSLHTILVGAICKSPYDFRIKSQKRGNLTVHGKKKGETDIPRKQSFLSGAEIVIVCISGIIAGFINGFLGSGGGVVLVLVCSFLFSGKKGRLQKIIAPQNAENRENDVPSDPKEYFSTAVASILPMSVVSIVFYAFRGDLNLSSYLEFPISAVFGGILGAFMTDKIPSQLLKTVFAALTVWAGIRML